MQSCATATARKDSMLRASDSTLATGLIQNW
jgi:hypothetical protein